MPNPTPANPPIPAALIGTWRMVRSEIPPPHDPAGEFYHVMPDGEFLSEQPFLKQSRRVFSWRYVVIDGGIRVTMGTLSHDLPLRFDGDLLVMTGPHGYSSWLQRIIPYLQIKQTSEICS